MSSTHSILKRLSPVKSQFGHLTLFKTKALRAVLLISVETKDTL